MPRFAVILVIAAIFVYSLSADQVRKCTSDTDCTNGEKCVQKNKICATIAEIERCEKEHFTSPCKSNGDCQVWAHEKICNKGCCWDLL